MIDTLIEKIKLLGAPIVVGLDPTLEMLPERLKRGNTVQAISEAFFEFNREIIDAVYDLVPAVKPQIAMYEQYGLDGLSAYMKTTEYAKSKGLLVIGDIKRGDIASTAAAYATHIGGTMLDEKASGTEANSKRVFLWNEDAVTLNPYLGGDSVSPFLDVCAQQDKAIFLLVKTSNPGSSDLQDMPLASGKLVYEHVADMVSAWGEGLIGKYGYSKTCAVVGATFPQQGRELRKRMPHTFFLVPGYGAQGGSGADLRGFFDEKGLGCIINSSRGITAAWKKGYTENDVGKAARDAVHAMAEDLQEAVR